jgi:MIP family channel proteins
VSDLEPASAPRYALARKVTAEAIGTFALVFAGCGAIMINTMTDGGVGHVGIGLTFGLVIMVMVYATGHICGAHFNPAVTIAFASVGRFPWREVPAYIGGQIMAATAAALCLYALLGPVGNMGATLPTGSESQSFLLEVIITFFLMFVITAVATDTRAVGNLAGWAIGGTVALASLFAGPISGASMNPARSIGPALAAGNFSHLWIYIVAPVVGASMGAVAYQFVRCGGGVTDAKGCC